MNSHVGRGNKLLSWKIYSPALKAGTPFPSVNVAAVVSKPRADHQYVKVELQGNVNFFL